MSDYKDRILDKYEYLLERFEEENDRKPDCWEDLALWNDAKDCVESEMEARADYLRKVDKGE